MRNDVSAIKDRFRNAARLELVRDASKQSTPSQKARARSQPKNEQGHDHCEDGVGKERTSFGTVVAGTHRASPGDAHERAHFVSGVPFCDGRAFQGNALSVVPLSMTS
jgi:hypothetical protein